jgi:hypothetical protein
MKLKVRMIIMSHLSDSQELTGLIKPDVSHEVLSGRINHHINFAKYLLMKYPDTNVEVDADLEYEEFQKKHPNL